MTHYLELFICAIWSLSHLSGLKDLFVVEALWDLQSEIIWRKQKKFKRIICIVLSQNKG